MTASSDRARPRGAGEGDVTIVVRLLGVPPGEVVDLLAALDALHREVQVAGLDAAVVAPSAVRGLVDDRSRLDEQRQDVHDQAVAARAAGAEAVEITMVYRRHEVPRVRSATAALGEAHAAAVAGDLLVPPLTPAQHRLWRYISDQFEAQVAGEPPTPYRTDG